MELQRQEYPALLTSLQPGQAVIVLNDRVQTIERVNSEIAEWLAERRAVENAYAQGLRRLAGRRPDVSLGVFQTPWQSVVTACESLADSHSKLAQNINNDVEKPLRDYSKNKEMSGIMTVQGNMTSLAKDVEEAQKRSDKIMGKGNKADNSKLSSALSSVQEAQQQWETTAPYVFEQLQALDEHRVNHLRDILTQLQTHQSDQLERGRNVIATSLEIILNIDTNEEISTFVARTTGAAPTLPGGSPNARRMSRLSMGSTTSRPNMTSSSDVPPVPEIPRALTVPSTSNRRGSSPSATGSREQSTVPETPPPKKGGMGGLRRLGTVMRRGKDKENKQTSGPSTEKKAKTSRNPLKRELADTSSQGASHSADHNATTNDTAANGAPPAGSGTVTAAAAGVTASVVAGATAAAVEAGQSSPQANGSAHAEQSQGKLAEASHQAEKNKEANEAEKKSSAVDDITRAQQEAAAVSESDQPQFQVNIRNEPIPEEGDDAKAITDTANILRQGAQPPQRKVGTLRGRRDVRNTMFVPSNVASDLANLGEPSLTSPPTDGVRTNTLSSLSPVGTSKLEDTQSADTQSIRSARSLSSMGPTAIRHPELTAPGISASIVETVSASLAKGQVTKVTAIGEMALAYNTTGDAGPDFETMRIDNFQVLEKVAPNPSFITPIAGRSGEYTIALSHIKSAQVGFKYQVHLDETNLGSYAPVLLTPVWKVEPTQTSVILNYAFNPAFAGKKATLSNAVLMIGIVNTKATSCLSKPSGTFSKEKNMIFWRLGDVHLEEGSAPGKLLARFTTEAEATPGTVEARWEITSEHATGMGSGLGLSISSKGKEKERTSDENPFEGDDEGSAYREVPVQRKLISGKYVAN